MLVFFLVFCLHICLVLFNLNHNALTDCMWQIFFAWNYFVRLHIILKGTLQHLLWKVWNVSGIKGHHLTNPLQQTFFECTLFQKSNWQPNASTALPLLPFPPFFFFLFLLHWKLCAVPMRENAHRDLPIIAPSFCIGTVWRLCGASFCRTAHLKGHSIDVMVLFFTTILDFSTLAFKTMLHRNINRKEAM